MFRAKSLVLLGILSTAVCLTLAEDDTPESNPIVTVIETWELKISKPDPNTCSPQIATQMTPNKDTPKNYGIFNINYQEIPSFNKGGIELQLWEGDTNTSVKGRENDVLRGEQEVLTWKQSLNIVDGKMQFKVSDGESYTFGNFGGEGFRVTSTRLASNLNNYDPGLSVKNSGVLLGENRVAYLKIKSVKKIREDGTEEVSNVERFVIAPRDTN